MGKNLPEKTIVRFIQNDFESAWDALAHLPGPLPRGNFLFAKQAMVLLEVACRLCASDSTGKALADFGDLLQVEEQRYFTELPGPCWKPNRKSPDFLLPSRSKNPPNELLAALFDTVRNGQAHQYQQIRVELGDKRTFQVALTGAEHQAYLASTFAQGRPTDHLAASIDRTGDILLKVLPQVLFLDIKRAIKNAKLLERGLKLKYLSRTAGKSYDFDSSALWTSLQASGH